MIKEPINITLIGDPVSVNQMWRSGVTNSGRPYTYMPEGAKDLKDAWQLQAQLQFKKMNGDIIESDTVHVSIAFFFKSKLRRDVDNYVKVVLDTLTGIVYHDDKQIQSIAATKAHDRDNPRIEIEIINQ